MSSSLSSISDPETEMSQSCSRSGESAPRLVMDALPDAGPALEDAAAEADADAKDDPTLGGWGSGVMLVKRVSHAAPPSGLKLRSRSPRPSRFASTRACRILRLVSGTLLRARTLSDKFDLDVR